MSEQKFKLFREKSLEAIESPESLTDYLRVTSPRIWLVLAAVMLLLIGVIIWGIVGRIGTTANIAVVSAEQGIMAYIPQDNIDEAMDAGIVTVNGQACKLDLDNVTVAVVSQDVNVKVILNGTLKYGDVVYCVPIDAQLDYGIYTGVLETESIQPISLLFN